jgi:S-adenosylmethionine:tRNA ribosyltransferase-isomerase
MIAASWPRNEKEAVRLLVVESGELLDSTMEHLSNHLRSGDLVVVNDAATLPASLRGHDSSGNPLEVRLSTQLNNRRWRSVTFGEGDWRIPTENRFAPPALRRGDEIVFSSGFRARVGEVNSLSRRLVDLEFDLDGEELWEKIYRYGKPVQYSYMNSPLDLWSVQNVYSGRPWSVEMPSAGHALNWRTILRLAENRIDVAALTHGAGLSATGDPQIDRALPLEERFEIPISTMNHVQRTRARGGRVIAIGTSVVRALESSSGRLEGFTDLRIGAGHQLQNVDGILTGTHDVSESHYQLLRAFLSEASLREVSLRLEEKGYLTHEFGDLCLIIPE